MAQTSEQFWREKLNPTLEKEWAERIDAFETEITLKKQNKIGDKIFAETRLRKGAYGQRYDNGQRHDGQKSQPLNFPCGDLTKGPNTVWDAPGMGRIKIPYGGLTLEQLDVLADLAEEYSDSILHITTRQDIQLHFVHIEDTPSMFRRLAAVGITTQEACGNSIRNITGCPFAGVCADEAFDTTGYADAMFRYLLGHPDVQDFGRKFKIAFSGCKDHPCAMTGFHDLGLIAKTKEVDGKIQKGFEFYVGGGLGAVPYQAQLLSDFVTEEEVLPLTQAVCRVYARHGEKKNRNRARVKFLVKDWGIEKFTEEVNAERAKLKPDPNWHAFLKTLNQFGDKALRDGQKFDSTQNDDPVFQSWLKNNVKPQKNDGYYLVTVALPLGDITSNQSRDLISILGKYTGNTLRTTVEQNLVLRWVSGADLFDLYQDLKQIGLGEPHAQNIVDITSCPGTDTCKLGVSASRGLAGELTQRLSEKYYELDEKIQGLRIKVSGCFNSCSQHHVADIGFYGISRKSEGRVIPHFQLVLGGSMQNNGASYGMPVGAFPSKAIPQIVEELSAIYLKERSSASESFFEVTKRLGKLEIKKRLRPLMQIPAYAEKPEYYTDWSDVREFTVSDIGVGECAGEVVSLTDFGLTEADRLHFEAQVDFDENRLEQAKQKAVASMLKAAQALIKDKNPDISEDQGEILAEFDERFLKTELFFDPFAKDKFARYLLKNVKRVNDDLGSDHIREILEEAHLFIEAAYSCNIRMSMEV